MKKQIQCKFKKMGGQGSFLVFAVFLCLFLIACQTDEERQLFIDELATQVSEEAEPVLEKNEPQIVVYICGAVKNPGVYTLDKGSRVAQGLELAGGFAPGASKEFVNLAAVLTDGEQVYFPEKSEAERLLEEQSLKEQGKVNINTATLEEFMTLTGIGESRAKDIIAYRTSNGAFETPEDLMQVPGIKESTYNRFKDMIYVN